MRARLFTAPLPSHSHSPSHFSSRPRPRPCLVSVTPSFGDGATLRARGCATHPPSRQESPPVPGPLLVLFGLVPGSVRGVGPTSSPWLFQPQPTCPWLGACLEPMTLPAAIHLWTFRLSGSCAGMSITAKNSSTGKICHEAENRDFLRRRKLFERQNWSTERDEKSETLHLPMSITMLTRPDSSLYTML